MDFKWIGVEQKWIRSRKLYFSHPYLWGLCFLWSWRNWCCIWVILFWMWSCVVLNVLVSGGVGVLVVGGCKHLVLSILFSKIK